MERSGREGRQDTGAGPDVSGYVTYLKTNRAFSAVAVSAAIRSIDVIDRGRPVRVLDAGTGGGGALEELVAWVRAHGSDGRGSITAVDIDARAVEVARTQVDAAWAAMVDLRVADLYEVAADTVTGDGFDLIWASDVVWPATFDAPSAVVRALAEALAPGGVLALFTTNYYQSMFLPGHSRIERLIRTASELTWGLPDDGPTHYERLGAWMCEAGLLDVDLRVFPLVSRLVDPVTRTYLEQAVWPEMRHAAASRGRAAGMSEADVARAETLLDPGSASWVGADPNGYVVQPTLLWTGRVS